MSTASSCPALLLYTSKSNMESFEKSHLSTESRLEPPSLVDYNIDEEDVKVTIKPRLSPLPRRRSSESSDDGELEPPTTVARKVSFADAFGFDLVSVKEFDTWELPSLSQNFAPESIKIEEFYLTPSFILPPADGIMERLYTKKVTLESVDFIPGTTSMKGIIRVLNLSYEKQIYVRMSLDNWQSYYDLLAEYVPDSCNGETDQFFFTISLVSPYKKEGSRVEFSICYETAVGTYWDNNEGLNYVLTCQKKEHLVEVNTQSQISEDVTEKNKKSCLKTLPSKEDEDLDVFQVENPTATEKSIPTIHCSYDEFSKDSNEEEKEDKSKETNNGEESDLEMFLSQRLMKARITSSEEKHSIGYSEETTFQNKRALEDKIQEPEECNESRDYLPLTLAITSLAAEDLPSTSSANSHSHEVLSEESLSEREAIALCFDDLTPTNQITKQEQISPGMKDQLQKSEPGQCSIIEEQNKHSISKNSLTTTQSTSNPQTETILFTEILDDNANLSYNENIVNVPYFLTGDTKGLKEEKNVTDKTETMENRFPNNTVSNYYLKENDELLVLTDTIIQECPMSCSQIDDSQDLAHEWEPSNNIALNEQQAESNEAIISHASSDATYIFREGQVKGTSGKKSKNTDLIVSFCEDPKTIHDISEISVKKQYTSTEKETLSPTLPKLIAKEYYVTSQDSNVFHCDHEKDNMYDTNDKKNVVLSEHVEQYIAEYTLRKEEETDIYETDRTVPGACGLTDFTEQELSYQRVSFPECPSSVASTAVENMTPSNMHAWKEMLGCDPSEVTQGNKVIIAKITEEKGQSETHSQGEKNPSYIDIGQVGNVKEQKEISKESKQKCILVSEANIELSSEINVAKHLSIGNVRANSHRECGNINTSKLKNFAEEDIIFEHEEYISKEQYEIHCDHRPNSLDAGQDVHHLDADPIIQSNNNFAALVDNTDTDINVNVCATAKNETVEFTDLLELTITEQSTHLVNVHDRVAEGNTGPSILISEPDDEGILECRETEEQNKLEDTLPSHYPLDDYESHVNQHIQCDTNATEPLNIGHVRSKVLCFIMFVVFAGLMYQYDFLVCFALYLFSLYWLYWEGDKGKTPVRKE